MLTVLSVLGKLFVSGFLFFLFGYFETLATTGVIVSISIASYLTLFKSSKGFSYVLSIVLLVSEIVGRVCEFKLVCFCSFLALNILLLRELLISNESNDLLVKMKPCEKEIRAILFEKDPAVLHRVDFWLDKHKGHERELLEKVKQKYLRESETESEEESGSDSEEEQPRLQGRQATAAPAPSPPVSQLRTPASIRPQANPNFYYTPQQKEVLALIQQYDPNLLPGSHRLLADYRGRESELLHQLRTEYGLVLDPPVSSSGSRAGPAQAAYRYNQHHGGGVQLPNSYTTSDGVRDYYGSGSTAPQFGKTSPLSGPFSSPPSSSSPYYATGNGRSSGDVHNRGRIYN